MKIYGFLKNEFLYSSGKKENKSVVPGRDRNREAVGCNDTESKTAII